MKHATFALIAILIAVPARAQSINVPAVAYVISGQIDAWSTIPIPPGEHEQNPFGAWLYAHGGASPFVAGTLAADTVTAYAINRWIGQHHPRAAKITLYVLSAVRVSFAVHNTYVVPTGGDGHLRKKSGTAR